MTRFILLSGALCLGFAGAASAQTAEQLAMMHQMAGNQLGVLEYCQGKSFIEAGVVETQRGMMAQLPPPADKASVDAAEQLGRGGTVSVGGNSIVLADAAKAQNVTEAALCKQMGDMVVAGARQMQGATGAAPQPAAP